MVLVLTDKSDPLMSVMLPLLEDEGARPVRFNTADFPQGVRVSVDYQFDPPGITLSSPGTACDLSGVRAIWNRRPLKPRPDPRLSEEAADFALRESKHFVESIWHLLGDRFWVNGFEATNAAEHKPFQLQVARALGFQIPKTLVTSSPEDAVKFFDDCRGNIVYKGFIGHARVRGSNSSSIYTSRLTRADLDAHADQIALTPCIFQEYTEKSSELRVTIVGRRKFTCRILSQEDSAWKSDWRRHPQGKHPRHVAATLPDSLDSLIDRLMEQLGLVFGCVDLAVTPDGRIVFFEINANGQWHWVERETGLPIARNLAKMLAQRTPNYAN